MIELMVIETPTVIMGAGKYWVSEASPTPPSDVKIHDINPFPGEILYF